MTNKFMHNVHDFYFCHATHLSILNLSRIRDLDLSREGRVEPRSQAVPTSSESRDRVPPANRHASSPLAYTEPELVLDEGEEALMIFLWGKLHLLVR